MRLENFLALTHTSLINEPCVNSFENIVFEASKVKRGDLFFAFDEKEKTKILKKLKGKKITIQRSKGLGENDPDMMNETTMNPKSRRLIQVTSQDLDSDREMFNTLLGEDLQSRKEFIAEHGHKFMDMLDIS